MYKLHVKSDPKESVILGSIFGLLKYTKICL